MRRWSAAALMILSGSPGFCEPVAVPADLVRQAAAAYRDGRVTEALRGSGHVLELDPANAAAKNLVWTIAQDARKKGARKVASRQERESASALARRYLAERRKKTELALEELKRVEARSGDLRSPTGLLSALGGLDEALGGQTADRFGERAQVHFSNILRNLEEALQKQVFAGRRDHLRAQGYLAYYKKDWDRAVSLWEKALQEDPSDAQIRNDLDSLKTLLRRNREKAELDDFLNQAETYFETGLYAQAAAAWTEVLKRDRRYPGAVESLAACRAARDKAEQRKRLTGMMEEASEENRAGRSLRAAEICLEALQIDPTYTPARALLKLVGKKIVAVEPPSARPSLPAQAPAPSTQEREKAEPLYKQGLLLYSDGDVGGAVKLWRQALALDSSLSKAREALRQGEAELAILQK